MAHVTPSHLASFAHKGNLLRGKNAAKDLDSPARTMSPVKLTKSLTRESTVSTASRKKSGLRALFSFGPFK
ncbi:hypothetical protein HDU87_007857 [Geranomyces variabilis]|uniref:Uncharacterized protein n=1 Tax=Geranomyces variabilis TaxID=109894 RepID=A0AAD5XN09_9FUNG|nr:hypothetical protein HDU87_007857 [Geranomyces variabilis]